LNVQPPVPEGEPVRTTWLRGLPSALPEREPIELTRPDYTEPELFRQLLAAVERVARVAAFTLGPEVEAFESEFAAYCRARCVIGVSSGTSALALALRALGVGPGDEVIVPANSFVGTAEAVTIVGAIPKPVDVDPVSYNITAAIVAENIGPATRCVIPVHLYGRTVDLDPIMALADEHDLFVLEDACQAHGALYGGRHVGAIGHCGAFSFYPSKNLGGWGDGGAVVTNDAALAADVRALRAHGEVARHDHRLRGETARLDALQASVLRVKLRHLDEWNQERRRVGKTLTDALSGSYVGPPESAPEGQDHVYHQYVVQSEDRDRLRRHLSRLGIPSAVHYPVPIHLTPAYRHLGIRPGSIPVAEYLAEHVCSLPMHPGVGAETVRKIVDAIHEFGETLQRREAPIV
jgi:dTDP-3-amino-3,4,6-trideoxy-alpha-D-glucose transaminase